MAILGISIFAILLALRYIYITGYSLLKQEQEIPTVVRIFRKIFFLDYPLKLVIIGVIVFLLFFLLLYVVVSLFLYSKFDIPFL